MADTTLADALVLFTKVNTKLLDRLEGLEDSAGKGPNKKNKVPEQVVEQAKPVEVQEFGKKAIEQLGLKLGVTPAKGKEKPKKAEDKNSLLDWLMGLLGLGGLAELGWKKLKDMIGKWIKDKLLSKLKNILEDLKGAAEEIWGKLKGAAEWVWGKLKGAGEWLVEKGKQGWKAIVESDTGKAIASFFEKIGTWMSDLADSLIKKASSLGEYLLEKFNAAKKAIANVGKKVLGIGEKTTETVTKGGKGIFKTIAEKASSVGKTVVGAAKTVASKTASVGEGVVQVAKTAGSKVISAGESVVEFGGKALSKGKALAEFLGKFKAIKFGGKLFNNILKRIPILATLIQTFFSHREIKELVEKHDKDPQKYPLDMLFSEIGDKAAEGLGTLIGGEGGEIIGGILGSIFPGPGNVIGGVLGALGGSYAGGYLSKLFAGMFEPQKKAVGKYLYDKFYAKKSDEETDSIEDGIITKEGKVIQPHKDDTIYAMKDGGPFDKFFSNNSKLLEQSNNALNDLTQVTSLHLSKQTELLTSSNKILLAIKDALGNAASQGSNIVTNNVSSIASTPSKTLRDMQYRKLEVGSFA